MAAAVAFFSRPGTVMGFTRRQWCEWFNNWSEEEWCVDAWENDQGGWSLPEWREHFAQYCPPEWVAWVFNE